MARTKEFDPEEAVDRALELFWAHGYEGTSLTQLLAGMGINRQSLYDTFGGKEQLYERAMARYREQVREMVVRPLREEPSGLAAIEQVLDAAVRMGEVPGRGSCFMANTAVEFGSNGGALVEEVGRHLKEAESAFRRALAVGRARGEIESPQGDRALARFLTATMHGLGILARAGAGRHELQDVRRVCLATLRCG